MQGPNLLAWVQWLLRKNRNGWLGLCLAFKATCVPGRRERQYPVREGQGEAHWRLTKIAGKDKR